MAGTLSTFQGQNMHVHPHSVHLTHPNTSSTWACRSQNLCSRKKWQIMLVLWRNNKRFISRAISFWLLFPRERNTRSLNPIALHTGSTVREAPLLPISAGDADSDEEKWKGKVSKDMTLLFDTEGKPHPVVSTLIRMGMQHRSPRFSF